MPAQWTGELVGKMHVAGITAKELAREAGLNPKYLSTILNGHIEPKHAEQVLRNALERLLDKQGQNIT